MAGLVTAAIPGFGSLLSGMGSMSTGIAGATGMMGQLGGSAFGKAVGGGLGMAAGKGLLGMMFGGGKGKKNQTTQGGCSCSSAPKMSCEQKCQYGRYMNEKCRGCKGYSGKGPGGKRNYRYGSTTSTYTGKPYSYKSGYKGRPKGRQARLAWRDFKKETKRPRMQARKDIGGPKWGKRR